MRQFVKDSEVLNSTPFISYEVQYHVFHRIADTEFSLLLANGDRSCIVGQSSKDMPFHVFFSGVVSEQEKEGVFRELVNEIKPDTLTLMTAPEHINAAVKAAAEHGGRLVLNLRTNAYECKDLKKPPYVSGFRKADSCDFEIVAGFLSAFGSEALGAVSSAALEDAKAKIDAGGMYLLTEKEESGIICAMANITHRSPRHARINCVYTVPEYRGMGLCKEITARMCEMIFAEGLTPCLFADYEYEPSNRAYRAIGFEKKGEMSNFSIKF